MWKRDGKKEEREITFYIGLAQLVKFVLIE